MIFLKYKTRGWLLLALLPLIIVVQVVVTAFAAVLETVKKLFEMAIRFIKGNLKNGEKLTQTRLSLAEGLIHEMKLNDGEVTYFVAPTGEEFASKDDAVGRAYEWLGEVAK